MQVNMILVSEKRQCGMGGAFIRITTVICPYVHCRFVHYGDKN